MIRPLSTGPARNLRVSPSTLYQLALGAEKHPDAWQVGLATDAWPRVLIAPTGSGKTAAVTLGWAAHRLRSPEQTPRRLVWCLPMRTLVEQTAEAVRAWFGKLTADMDDNGRLPRPDDVHVLMGGVEADGWLERPERPAVLVGTQDMLLSRALMRGYASLRALWPMEFALLHEDAQWVFDEVQLMGAGRATSAQLEAFRQSEADRARRDDGGAGMPSRSLWISATLKPGWLATVDHPEPPDAAVLRVDPAATSDGRLSRLVRATKRLARSLVAPASSKKTDLADYVGRLADAILNAHRTGSMTLAIVNRVDRAQALHGALDKKLSKQAAPTPTLALVHSRFRPADRAREMNKVIGTDDPNRHDRIVVATQAIEAGIDLSAAVLFTELAPWSSLVQRFGRANRYAELPDGAEVHWIDLIQPAPDHTPSDKDAEDLALPYEVAELRTARDRLTGLSDVAPVCLPPPDDLEAPRRVIRRKDLDELFDTDPDLTGFDVDISPYVRDADDTDIRVFWRDSWEADGEPPRPGREELCAVSIGTARTWISKLRKLPHRGRNLLFQRDPQWRRRDGRTGAAPPGWMPLEGEPWPGLVLLAVPKAGGYREESGFTGDPKHAPEPISRSDPAAATRSDGPVESDAEGHDEDPLSRPGVVVPLADHLHHVAAETESLCSALDLHPATQTTLVRAARWHDLGKAHTVFQDTMRRGLDGRTVAPDVLLAKTAGRSRHGRAYFRHELASALAFLAHENWSRSADLVAYLIAAHHGKVRMNLRALPRESSPKDPDRAGLRFARGVWEGDELPPFVLEDGEHWEGGSLLLSIMELGWDDVSHESWTERTRELLARLGPFRLAWLEALLRVADWRASAKECDGGRNDG
jgi:CRISPR-associated endonuclease/helicase Cas3